jgi:hypothetical protein
MTSTSVHSGPGPHDPRLASDPRPLPALAAVPYPEWGPVIGAIAAAALAFVLHSFAFAIGLSVSSAAPTWRDALFALVALSGLYIILAALVSYGLGGYLAGLMRARLSSREDADLRDGIQGLLAWALATLLTAVIGLATVQALTHLGAPSGGQTGPSASIAGENVIAYDSIGCFARNAAMQPILSILEPRLRASCSPHRAIAACNRTTALISCV